MELADKKCSDGGNGSPLDALRERELLKELGQGWGVNAQGHLARVYILLPNHLHDLPAGLRYG